MLEATVAARYSAGKTELRRPGQAQRSCRAVAERSPTISTPSARRWWRRSTVTWTSPSMRRWPWARLPKSPARRVDTLAVACGAAALPPARQRWMPPPGACRPPAREAKPADFYVVPGRLSRRLRPRGPRCAWARSCRSGAAAGLPSHSCAPPRRSSRWRARGTRCSRQLRAEWRQSENFTTQNLQCKPNRRPSSPQTSTVLDATRTSYLRTW